MWSDGLDSRAPAPRGFGILLSVLPILLPAPGLQAQVVRGTVADSLSGAPVQGVFVSLLDSASVRRASTLSDASGAYLVRAPEPGTYRLRVERIGFRTATTASLRLTDTTTVLRRDLRVPSATVELEGLSVSAERVCDTDAAAGGEVARLWNEVRKAISVAEWVDDGRLLRYRVRRYARTLDANDLRVEEESTRQQVTRSRQPFRAPDPDSLVAHGYVQERDGELYYHAPDPRALLSDGFVRTHCFSVELPRSQRDRELVGIGFTPVDGREVPDISGTLWIDRGTAELRRMDFFYTGLEGVRRSAQLGGRVEFRRLRTGAWIVDRWRIRMPIRGGGAPGEGGTRFSREFRRWAARSCRSPTPTARSPWPVETPRYGASRGTASIPSRSWTPGSF